MLLVITGKTASGKDTVIAKVLAALPNFSKIITTTPRIPRPEEKNGIDYYFISEEEFQNKMRNNEFLEYVEYGGNLYGTEKSQFTPNADLIWKIEASMAGKVKLQIINYKLIVIYITTDDEVVLERLKERDLSDEEIQKRMADDKRFWEEYKDNYDFVVENVPGKLNETVDKIIKIIENHNS